jgi:hypothetical protein
LVVDGGLRKYPNTRDLSILLQHETVCKDCFSFERSDFKRERWFTGEHLRVRMVIIY